MMLILGNGCIKKNENGNYSELDYFKFSDFGCQNDNQWSLSTNGVNYIISSQEGFDEHLIVECNPIIDFESYTLLVGNKQFSTGVSIYSEKVKENNSEVIYEVTFLTDDTYVAQVINYHVIINKPLNGKTIRITAIVKETS